MKKHTPSLPSPHTTNPRPLHRWPLLLLITVVSTVPAFAQSVGDFRSITSSNWNSVATWERYDGANWVGGFFPTNANAGVITIRNSHSVTNTASVTADQIVVAEGGTLALSSTLTVANGAGSDLDVSGTLIALGGSSVITLLAG